MRGPEIRELARESLDIAKMCQGCCVGRRLHAAPKQPYSGATRRATRTRMAGCNARRRCCRRCWHAKRERGRLVPMFFWLRGKACNAGWQASRSHAGSHEHVSGTIVSLTGRAMSCNTKKPTAPECKLVVEKKELVLPACRKGFGQFGEMKGAR